MGFPFFVPSHLPTSLSLKISFVHVANPLDGIRFAFCLLYTVDLSLSLLYIEPVHKKKMCVTYAFAGVSKPSIVLVRVVSL